MEKGWFIKVDDAEEGPFTPAELKCHPRLTPDTLVRREGSSQWTPIRYIVELKEVFEDAPAPTEEEAPPLDDAVKIEEEELLLDWPEDSPPFLFFIMVMLLILIYSSYHLYQLYLMD